MSWRGKEGETIELYKVIELETRKRSNLSKLRFTQLKNGNDEQKALSSVRCQWRMSALVVCAEGD